MSQSSILYQRDQRGVARVTLQRPEKHNAFDDQVIAELMVCFDQLRHNPPKLMVLASEGKHFSAGADLAWMKRMARYSEDENRADARALAEMLEALDTLPFPTIARVQGAAFGGAVGLIACCDMAVATEDARFCLSEVKLGLIPATISPYVIEAMGPRAARRYFLSAETFDASTAKSLGLLSEVSPKDTLDAVLDELIEKLMNNSPAAQSAAKDLIKTVSGKPVDDQLIEETSRRIAAIRVSPEGQEGLTAFLEKRQPDWQKVQD